MTDVEWLAGRDAGRAGEARGVILRTEGPQPLALVTAPGLPEAGIEARCYVPKPLPGAEPGDTPALVVGDRVRLRPRDDEVYEILEREPRVTALQRGDPARPGVQTIVANVDKIICVVALVRPEPSRYRLDRLLVLAEQAGIPATVCLNKVDLAADEAEADRFLEDYRRAGYDTLATSAKRGIGLDALRERLRGETTALVGESGVGKSSLLSALYPELGLRIGELTVAGRGAHTTTAARLLATPDGFIADTPGIQYLLPADLEPAEVPDLFPELRALDGRCRFPNCTHLQEAGCAVLAAVADGRISEARYESYVALRGEVEAAWERQIEVFYRNRRREAGRAARTGGSPRSQAR